MLVESKLCGLYYIYIIQLRLLRFPGVYGSKKVESKLCWWRANCVGDLTIGMESKLCWWKANYVGCMIFTLSNFVSYVFQGIKVFKKWKANYVGGKQTVWVVSP